MAKPARISTAKLLEELIKDPDRKPALTIIAEVFSLALYFRSFPKHYFSRYLFKKGKTNIRDYFPNTFLYYKIKPFLNDAAVRDVVENKLYFDFFYKQFNISLPKILMYNHRKNFVVGNICTEINNSQDFRKQLEKVFKQNESYDSIIVKRTYGTYGGDKVYRIYRNDINTETSALEALYTEVIKAGFLFQETVKQHPELNKLNPSCVNTIRFDTFIDKDGKIEIMSAYIRMSIKNAHVDNISSGGCMVAIDLQTGTLKNTGYSSISTSGVRVLKAHPITMTVFNNFSIPYFEEAKEMVIKAAGLMPGLRIIGWDMAIGESGPVLIEGNSDYSISGNDFMYEGYRSNPVFRKVLKELNLLR